MNILEFIRDRARYYNCPVCAKSLKGCTVRMLSQVDDRFTVQVTCRACDVTFIVVLAIDAGGMESTTTSITGADDEVEVEIYESLGLDDDDPAESPVRAEPKEPIQVDELIDLHLLLRDFHGPLTELVKERDPAG